MEGSTLLSSWGLFERSDAMMTHSFVVGSCLSWGIESPSKGFEDSRVQDSNVESRRWNVDLTTFYFLISTLRRWTPRTLGPLYPSIYVNDLALT